MFHRLLEGDLRCHTKILGRSGSGSSVHSAKSAGSQRGSVVEVEGHQTVVTPTTKLQTAQPLHTQLSVSEGRKSATPPSSPEVPVKSKPAAPYFNEELSESSQEGSSEGEGEGGLGPEASIILDDELGTKIDLEVVLPSGGGVANGSGLDDEEAELEVPNEPGGGGNLQPLPNLEPSRTVTLSPAEQLQRSKDNESSEASDGDGSNNGEAEDVCRQEEEQEVDVEEQEEEERDELPELKRGTGRGRGKGGTVKRARSETETGRKVSLASLVGRVRSQTIMDGGLKEKHLSNKVYPSCEQVTPLCSVCVWLV